MRKQTSQRNPPSTGYQRPTERKFYIWEDRHISYSGYSSYAEGKWGPHPWRWLCTICDPPAYGFRARRGAYQRIIAQTMPRHFAVRRYHHEWAARRPLKGS